MKRGDGGFLNELDWYEGKMRANDWRSVYLLSRVMYALPEHVRGVGGQKVRVGSHVSLARKVAQGTYQGSSDYDGVENDPKFTQSLIVPAICPHGDCVELEHTFVGTHDLFGVLEVPSKSESSFSCPFDHQFKCSHLGHSGTCRFHYCKGCSEIRQECRCDVCSGCDSQAESLYNSDE